MVKHVKAFVSLFVIAVLIVSAVPAFADDDAGTATGGAPVLGPPSGETMPPTVEGGDTGMTNTAVETESVETESVETESVETESVETESGEDDQGEAGRILAHARKRPRPLPVAARERLREEVHDRRAAVGPLKRTREKVRERFAELQKRYVTAREHYLEARKQFLNAKEKILTAREKWKKCQDNDSEACRRVRETMKENAKPFLAHSAEMVLNALERLKVRLTENDAIDPDVKARLLDDLDARIKDVTNAKAVVENLNETASPEEIRDAAKTIREAWRHTRGVIKRATGQIINAKLGNIIVQVEHLKERLQRTRDHLASQGFDVSALDDSLKKFEEKLSLAQKEWEQARDLWKEADSAKDIDAIAKEAHEHVLRAKKLLQEARGDLREIVREIKEQQGTLDLAGDAGTNTSTNATVDTVGNATVDNATTGNATGGNAASS